ncbi:PLP-dependent aminotransferase family protein [Maritalea sp.]|uniref:aminotransferase-like domain-containing protein n=1 Tax=Maritalea sp. TaxID=2003361 RepID=UPI0039E58768
MIQNRQEDTKETTSLVAQVMDAVQKRISSRSALPGSRVASIRDMANRMGVSKSTVVDAYDRLTADGIIISKPGSGFYVAAQARPFSIADVGPKLDQDIDPLWLTRNALQSQDVKFKPGCGWLPSHWMPKDDIKRALRSLARHEHADLTDYAPPNGLPQLRQFLSRRLANFEISAAEHQILLTESGTQALDLVCRYFLNPGDTVLIDDPCYFNFHSLLRVHRVNIVSVPYTHSGPDLVQFEQVLAQHKPKLYITNSALHNPTGASLAPHVAHRVLKLAEQHKLLIVEDDIFADFEPQPSTRLAAFDGLDRVIHIGSFSKTLTASIRCGYIAARADWVEELIDLKLATSFGGGNLSAQLVLSVLKDGSYRKHMNRVHAQLANAMTSVCANLKKIGLEPWLEPNAGMFLWCKLPTGLDATKVAATGLEAGVVLAPGNAFSLSHSATEYMRFNVAQTNNAAIYPLIEQAISRSTEV